MPAGERFHAYQTKRLVDCDWLLVWHSQLYRQRLQQKSLQMNLKFLWVKLEPLIHHQHKTFHLSQQAILMNVNFVLYKVL